MAPLARLPRHAAWFFAAFAATACAPIASAPPTVPPAAAPAAPAAAARALQALADAWPWEPREDAPWTAFPRGHRPPAGFALHLDFHARPGEDEPPAGSHQVYYRDGVPFTLRLVVGPAFAVLDRDASDGEATVAFPPGAHDGWLARLGEPGGTLAATDPIFFRRETLPMAGGPRDWVRLGARDFPFPWAAERGPDHLRFEPRGLTGFATRWYAGVAEVPPLPPAIADLTTPEELVAGTTGTVTAVAAGPGGLPTGTAFRWRTTDPDGRPLPEASTAGPALAWLAPEAPGRYLVDLTVETPYFRASAPAPKPIRVRRELFLDSSAPPAKGWADNAVAWAADTWPLAGGVTFDLTVEGTMNNYGAPLASYCGVTEPAPWWDTPGKLNGLVNLDPVYFFANLMPRTGCSASYAPVATRLIGYNLDGGPAYVALVPRERTYQPSHRYTFPALVGRDKPLRVRCLDPRVWDNYGVFKVTIRRPS